MNRLESVRKEVDAVLSNQKDAVAQRTGYVHLYGVAQICSMLAVKRRLNFELCSVAGMLHDIYTYKFEYVKDHAPLGANEADKLLRNMNVFTDEEIEIVTTAIRNHSDKKTKHDKYSELLKDADSMQNFLYDSMSGVKHRKRLKKVAKQLGLKIKLRKTTKEPVEES